MNLTRSSAAVSTRAPSIEEARASIDWAQAIRQVTKLRQRIFRATQQQEWRVVRDLQKLLLRRHANYVLSVRQVTQVNAGRRTPGVDGQFIELSRYDGYCRNIGIFACACVLKFFLSLFPVLCAVERRPFVEPCAQIRRVLLTCLVKTLRRFIVFLFFITTAFER